MTDIRILAVVEGNHVTHHEDRTDCTPACFDKPTVWRRPEFLRPSNEFPSVPLTCQTCDGNGNHPVDLGRGPFDMPCDDCIDGAPIINLPCPKCGDGWSLHTPCDICDRGTVPHAIRPVPIVEVSPDTPDGTHIERMRSGTCFLVEVKNGRTANVMKRIILPDAEPGQWAVVATPTG